MTAELANVQPHPAQDYLAERIDLAVAFRSAAKLNLHEAVANHFSLAVGDSGQRFLMNPNQRHFATLCASDMLLLDTNDKDVMNREGAPDPTAWGLHATLHRLVPHARCLMHVHPIFSTVLASLADSRLPAIDQNTAIFFDRMVIDEGFGGLAFEEEGRRLAGLLEDPKKQVMVIMGNHGILVVGATVAETINRLYYFERAAETYIRALQTGMPLRIIPDHIAEKTADEIADYPSQDEMHLTGLRAILDLENSDYAQ